MGDSSRIAALLAAWAFVGVTGCAKAPETLGEEAMSTAPEAEETQSAEEAFTADSIPLPDHAEPVDGADVALPIAPVGLRPPLCRVRAHLRSVAGGFICIGPGQFASRPFCERGWDLIRRGKGFMCKLVVRGPRGPVVPLEE